MKLNRLLLLFVLTSGVFLTSCSKDNNDEVKKVTPGEQNQGETRNLEVENFIYAGMNEIYLYKANVPELADNHFTTQTALDDYLAGFADPEDLFYNGLVDSANDRFSFLSTDYVALEKMLYSGTTTSSGMDYGLSLYSNTSNKVLGYVRYVSPNSPASEAGLERGDIFTQINGEQLTKENYQHLIGLESWTLTMGKLQNGSIVDTDETVDITKREYTEDPVFMTKVLDVDGQKVGYLMYNGFISDFDAELNNAFADFKAEGITDLVLDLRYNGGGSVETSVDLSSMITGQFEGEVFSREHWNTAYQNYFEQNAPDRIINKFNNKISTGEAINSLNLDEVYIIATGSTASASELVINCLEPYINVVQIGTSTVGKFQASVTLYDSPNFGRENANPDHTYAIQPLVLKNENANGKSDYVNGLDPDIEVKEYIDTMGTLGDPSEPLLNAAIEAIKGNHQAIVQMKDSPFRTIGEKGEDQPTYQRMYIDKLPAVLKNR
ncbi:MAG: S41 family peptidase [Salegentibacter sp.]